MNYKYFTSNIYIEKEREKAQQESNKIHNTRDPTYIRKILSKARITFHNLYDEYMEFFI